MGNNSYVILKDGRKMVIYSDNVEESTMHGYPAEQESYWDASFDVCEKWNYTDVKETG